MPKQKRPNRAERRRRANSDMPESNISLSPADPTPPPSGNLPPSPPNPPQSSGMFFGMPKSSFWLTVLLAAVAIALTLTDMERKFWLDAFAWVAVLVSVFYAIEHSEWNYPSSAKRLIAFVAIVLIGAGVTHPLKTQWDKEHPPPLSITTSKYSGIMVAYIYIWPNPWVWEGAMEFLHSIPGIILRVESDADHQLGL